MKTRLLLAAAALLALPACLDPIVGTQCARGYSPCGNSCMPVGTCTVRDAGQGADGEEQALVDADTGETEVDADIDAIETDLAADSEPVSDGSDIDAGTDDALPPEDAGLGYDGGSPDLLPPEIDAESIDADIDADAPSDVEPASPDSEDDVTVVTIEDALSPDDTSAAPDLRANDVPLLVDVAVDAAPEDVASLADATAQDSQLLCVGCPDAVEAGETVDGGDFAEAGEAGAIVGDANNDGADSLMLDSGTVDDAGPDGAAISDASDVEVDGALPDTAPLQCQTDLTSDPNNCGACGNVCATGYCTNSLCQPCEQTICHWQCVNIGSNPDNCGGCDVSCRNGLCSNSKCEATGTGRVIVIGHDYLVNRYTMNMLLGNAVFLWSVNPVHVLAYKGAANATAIAGADTAIAQVAGGRQVQETYVTDEDSLATRFLLDHPDLFLIYGQEGATSDSSLQQLGSKWSEAMTVFVAGGGTIIVLDGLYPANSGTVQIIAQTGLLNIQQKASVTRAVCTVAAPGDALASGMLKNYLCEQNSVSFTTSESGPNTTSVVLSGGDPVVIDKVFP